MTRIGAPPVGDDHDVRHIPGTKGYKLRRGARVQPQAVHDGQLAFLHAFPFSVSAGKLGKRICKYHDAMALTPPRIVPPSRPLGRIAFARTFVRNPLEVVPQAAYEEDFVSLGASRIWVTSPALIKAVLLDERDKFRKITQIRLLSPLLGKGILTSQGAEWKWQRQASSPMFRPENLAEFVPTFVRVARALVDKWRAGPLGATPPLDAYAIPATFRVLAATLLPAPDAPPFQRATALFQKSGVWD